MLNSNNRCDKKIQTVTDRSCLIQDEQSHLESTSNSIEFCRPSYGDNVTPYSHLLSCAETKERESNSKGQFGSDDRFLDRGVEILAQMHSVIDFAICVILYAIRNR